MPLPNPGMTFTPFDPLPASDLNDIVENIEGLQDWSAFDNDTLPANLIDFASDSLDPNGGVWWEELGRVVAPGGTSTMSLPSLPVRKRLQIIITGSSSSTGLVQVRLNNDSGNNYCRRTSTDGGADATAVSDNKLVNQTGGGANLPTTTYIDVLHNVAAVEKVIMSRHVANLTNGAANLPSSNLTFGKWANTSAQVTRVDTFPSTGNWNAGAELIVLGHD